MIKSSKPKVQNPLDNNIPDYRQNITFKIKDKIEDLKKVKDADIFEMMGGSTKKKKPTKKKKQPKKKRTRKKQ
jgi:hypothetical protein